MAEQSRGFPYDVYISFSEEDARSTFVGYLHRELEQKGINPFIDTEHIGREEGISSSISKAIEESKVLIVVLSESYASSQWCMDELVQILDSKNRNNKQLVFPVFYGVDPSDVLDQRKSYGKAMIEHERQLGKNSQKVQKWKLGLTEICNLKHLQVAVRYEFNYIEVIVEEICHYLKSFHVSQDLHKLEQVKEEKRLKKKDAERDDREKAKSGSMAKKSHGFLHDVCISCSEWDEMKPFVVYLRIKLKQKGINPFIIDNIDRRRYISSSASKAIEESKVSIIVLSNDYESSSWCLDALVQILDSRKRNNKQFVFPVFYHIHPSDVRNKYGKIMTKYEGWIDKDSQNLRDKESALTEILTYNGLYVSWGNEFNSIERIVKEISDYLKSSNVGQDLHKLGKERLKKDDKGKEMAEDDLHTIIKFGSMAKESHGFPYDVYIIISREVTRSPFIGYLHKELEQKGINPSFIDPEDIGREEDILSSVYKAIEESKVSIIVLSENYGSSRRRLDALVQILDSRKRNNKQFVFPIFYQIQPSNVEAMAEQRFWLAKEDFQDVQKWKSALVEIFRFKGLYVCPGYELNYIEVIVNEICDYLKSSQGDQDLYKLEQVKEEERLKKDDKEKEKAEDGLYTIAKSGFMAKRSHGFLHDVYISFSGEDIRSTFIAYLHRELKRNGIDPFDTQNIVREEDLSSSIKRVIEKTKVSIILFTENYGSSTWCLDELANILYNHHHRFGKVVLPVYYNVSPSNEPHKYIFYEAMAEHERRFGEISNRMQRWRSALSSIGWFPALEIDTQRAEINRIDEIVQAVCRVIDDSQGRVELAHSIEKERLKKEEKEKVDKEKEKAEDELYTIIEEMLKKEMEEDKDAESEDEEDEETEDDYYTIMEKMHRNLGRLEKNREKERRLKKNREKERRRLPEEMEKEYNEEPEHGYYTIMKSGSTAKQSHGFLYDVHISFSGEDIRSTFIGYLQRELKLKGINPFICAKDCTSSSNARFRVIRSTLVGNPDREFLRKGTKTPIDDDYIPYSVSKAIRETKVSIIVFSKTPAYSTFGLDELAMIIDSWKGNNKKLVLPVFYHVHPSEVIHGENIFRSKWSRKLSERMLTWRFALREICKIPGFLIENERSEINCIDEIVERVCCMIKDTNQGPVELEHSKDEERLMKEEEQDEEGEDDLYTIMKSGSMAKQSHGFPYEVFVSFRGEDTRSTFVGYLHRELEQKGINPFIDAEHIGREEGISSSISKAIEESKVSIVVLSENYASSQWCMDELVQILDSKNRNNKQLVFPVFYGVDPADVRLLRNSYREAMTAHEGRFGEDSEKVQKWKSAFAQIGSLNGFHVALGLEINYVKLIVKATLCHLKSLIVGRQQPVQLEQGKEEESMKNEEEAKEKEKVENELYTNIKVARDEDLRKQIGNDIYCDLVDHDNVTSFRVQKQEPFRILQEMVAEQFAIPVEFQRIWLWAKRQNHAYRLHRPLTDNEKSLCVGQLIEIHSELKLFLEVEFGPDLRPISPPDKSEDDMLLFFKLYDPEKEKLSYIGRLFVKSLNKPSEMLTRLNEKAGYDPHEQIVLFEEIEFKPIVKCKHINKESTFGESQIKDGSIICFQKAHNTEKHIRFPYVPSYLDYKLNPKVVRFRSLNKPKVDGFSSDMSRLNTYDDVVKRVAQQFDLDDPSKIRLTAHDCYSDKPMSNCIEYQAVDCLSDMLVDQNRTSDILYYEVLDIPLPVLQGWKILKVEFYRATGDEKVLHNVSLPRQSIVRDVLDYLKNQVELYHTNAEMRLLLVKYNKIAKVFSLNEKIERFEERNDPHWTLRAEEISEEEKNLGPDHRLINVCHFSMQGIHKEMPLNFGKPFLFVIHKRETIAEIKVRIQRKLQVHDDEFVEWKFAFVSFCLPKYLHVSENVFDHFKKHSNENSAVYLGLEHEILYRRNLPPSR